MVRYSYYNWLGFLDLKNKKVLLFCNTLDNYNNIKKQLDLYGAELSNEKKVDLVIVFNTKFNTSDYEFAEIIYIYDDFISYLGLNFKSNFFINKNMKKYNVFRRPHDKGYRYILSEKAPLGLVIKTPLKLNSLNSILIYLATKFEFIFNYFYPASIYFKGNNLFEKKIKNVLKEIFNYEGKFSYALVGDVKENLDSKIIAVILFDNKKYLFKTGRFGKNKKIINEYNILKKINEFNILEKSFFYSEKNDVLLLEYIEGNNLFDEFGLRKDINILIEGIKKVKEFHKKGEKIGIVHNDLGSVNFICSNEGINIIDWENYSLNGKQKDEIEMVITNFADLYHKVYGKKCCDDNNHTKIKKILREHY